MNAGPALGLALRVAACLALTFGVWKLLGSVPGLLAAVGSAAALLPRALVEFTGDAVRHVRAAAWRDLEGRHYEFRGHRFFVREDAEGHRWVRWRDVQQVLGPGARDAAMSRAWGASWCHFDGEACLEAEALSQHLRRDSREDAARLRQWVEREIVFPARNRRSGRRGVESFEKRSGTDQADQLVQPEEAQQHGRRPPDAHEQHR